MTKTCYEEYKKKPVWRVVEKSIKDLKNNKDIIITTDKDYVIGYIAKNISEAESKSKRKGLPISPGK